MLENDKCAHHLKYDEKNKTCFSKQDLIKISEFYNNSNIGNKNKIKIVDDKNKLINQLNNRLVNCKYDQICWLNQKFIQDKNMVHNIFKPQGTKGRIDWLSTIEINNVMKQYEKKYKNFKFIGAVPRDILRIKYPIMNEELFIKDLTIDYFIKNNYDTIGFIYNLDESWQSGSHWVTLYFNIKNCQIYFFDSYGLKPHSDIRKMIRKLANFCYHFHNTDCRLNCELVDSTESYLNSSKKNKLEKIYDIDFNRNRHQYKNTECGVYSLHFLINLLNGKSYKELSNKILNDEYMENYRNFLFRKLRN